MDEGYWLTIKFFAFGLSPIILPELIAYGSLAGDAKFSTFVVKTSLDVYTQVIFSDNIKDVNFYSAMTGAIVPKAFSGVASEGTQLIQQTAETGQLPNNQDMTSALLKSTLVPAQSNIMSGFMKATGAGNVAAEATGAAVSEIGGYSVDSKVQQYIKP